MGSKPKHWIDRQLRDDAKVVARIQAVFKPLAKLVDLDVLELEDKKKVRDIREHLRKMMEKYLHED